MDPRHNNPHRMEPPPSAHSQRFSWQEPADTGSAAARQSGDVPTSTPQLQVQPHQRHSEEAGRQSWIETPIEMRQGQHKWPSATLGKPSEPSIPQSPASPASPASPSAAATPVPAVPEKAAVPSETNPYQNLQAPIATHPALANPALASDHTAPLSSAQPTPPVSYAVLPQSAMAPLPAQSPPLTINTNQHAPMTQNPFSPGVMAPIPLSSIDPADQQQPSNAATTSSTPYTPYSNILHPTSTNGTASTPGPQKPKAQPFAPDDLIATRAAAVRQSRSDTTSTFNPAASSSHQPGQIAHPNMRAGGTGEKDEWSHSLFALTPDTATCCLGMVCPCIVHSRTSYRLEARSSGRDATDLLGFSSTNGSCAFMALLGCCISPLVLRARVRHTYRIAGGVGSDALASCCCCCCAVVQHEREVKKREEDKRRFEGPGGGEGYRRGKKEEMKYAPGGR